MFRNGFVWLLLLPHLPFSAYATDMACSFVQEADPVSDDRILSQSDLSSTPTAPSLTSSTPSPTTDDVTIDPSGNVCKIVRGIRLCFPWAPVINDCDDFATKYCKLSNENGIPCTVFGFTCGGEGHAMSIVTVTDGTQQLDCVVEPQNSKPSVCWPHGQPMPDSAKSQLCKETFPNDPGPYTAITVDPTPDAPAVGESPTEFNALMACDPSKYRVWCYMDSGCNPSAADFSTCLATNKDKINKCISQFDAYCKAKTTRPEAVITY